MMDREKNDRMGKIFNISNVMPIPDSPVKPPYIQFLKIAFLKIPRS